MTKKASDAARIITTSVGMQEYAWSWRKSWYSGSDSIYAVLAKFEALNRLKPRDLCELFIERNIDSVRGKRVGVAHYPKVDLRCTTNFRLGRLANLLQLDADQLRHGFVSEQFPNAMTVASADLVWCPMCAERGYHAASFQLNYHRQCPLHHEELRRSCFRCKQKLPYWLYGPRSVAFYVCPNCRHDHAPRLRQPRTSLSLKAGEVALFADHIQLVRFLDALPTLINAQKDAMGAPHLPIMISKADAFRRRAAFHQFVTDTLTSVAARHARSPQAILEVRAPSSVYREAYMALPEILKHSRIKRDTDERLKQAQLVYRTTRRWLRRRVVRDHRGCLAAAQSHLWWDMDGESTDAFCPVALAFLRWRMQWEGCRIPRSLSRQKGDRVPLGLLGWTSSEAPLPSPLWTQGLSHWVNNHILGFACLDSFQGWLRLARQAERSGRIAWDLHDHKRFGFRHWACCGRGTVDDPGLLYVENTLQQADLQQLGSCTGAHRRQHNSAISRIVR